MTPGSPLEDEGCLPIHSGVSLKPVGNDFGNGTRRLDGSDYRRDDAAAVSAIASGSQHSGDEVFIGTFAIVSGYELSVGRPPCCLT
jgi:hypothetical protein